jgi:RNA polymerase sigma factor (sigma-70 family)
MANAQVARRPAAGHCPARSAEDRTDRGLLGRFLRLRDESAFAALVRRHGPTVLGVCRRVLRHVQDAEDPFQATFLTLARKADSIGQRASLGSWLFKVAYRIAFRARRRRAARGGREVPLAEGLALREAGPGPAEALAWREIRPLLDAEIRRLPEKYQAAFVLCCLEGKTNDQAAEQLGCPKGTVLSRLARARERLRRRLAGSRIALGGVPFAPPVAQPARPPAEVSPSLVTGPAHLAGLVAAGTTLAGPAPPGVLALADEMGPPPAWSGSSGWASSWPSSSPSARARPPSFPDGTANTILFADCSFECVTGAMPSTNLPRQRHHAGRTG